MHLSLNSPTNRPAEAIRFVSSGNKPLYSVQLNAKGIMTMFEGQESTFPIGSKTFADSIRSKTWLDAPIGKPGLSGGAFLVKGDDGSQYIMKYMRGQPFYSQYVDSEIKMLMALVESPYVVTLLAATLYNEKAYILYPYIPGKTLAEWLRTNPDISDRKDVYIHLMNGLVDIHSRGYVHRDVKPANIWIPEDMSKLPFYLDLGLTAPIDSDEIVPGGTPTYMKSSASRETSKPEQNYYALGKIIEGDAAVAPLLGGIAAVMKQDGFTVDNMVDALTALQAGNTMPEINSAPAQSPSGFAMRGGENRSLMQTMNYPRAYTVAASPAPLSTHNAYATWPGGVDPSAALFNTDNQKGGARRGLPRKEQLKALRKAIRKATRNAKRKANHKNTRKANRKNTRKNLQA